MGYETAFLALPVTLVFVGLTGLYPGGIIVPSYLVLFVHQPARVAGTLIAAMLTLVCYRLISPYFLLFGRRRFVFMIFVAAMWTFLWLRIFPLAAADSPDFRVIGWIVPGLMANNFERQGVLTTTAAAITVTVAAHFISMIVFRFF